MSEYVTLIGAEDVRNAASAMKGAAEQMVQAASNISYALQLHERFLDDWLERFRAVVSELDPEREP